KGVWAEIKAEPDSIRDVYLKYILVMSAIPVVCEFIRMTTVGQDIPVIGTQYWGVGAGLSTSIVHYALRLAAIFIGAMVLEMLAPKFESSISRVDGVKLLAYAGTPEFVGGFFRLIPGLTV